MDGEVDDLALSYRDRVLTFRFAALSYRAPRDHRYRYRMEGLEDSWTETNLPSATYTGLPPGDYAFRVVASDHSGNWNAVGASVSTSSSR